MALEEDFRDDVSQASHGDDSEKIYEPRYKKGVEQYVENERPKSGSLENSKSSSQSSMDYEHLIETLDHLSKGYERMDPFQIAGSFASDGEWKNHPHDPNRQFKGAGEIMEMLEAEFEGLISINLEYDRMDIIFDSKRGIANVDWVISQKESLDDKRISEKQTSHSVILEFEGKFIKSLRSHSIKTNKGWTRRSRKKDVTDGHDTQVKKSSPSENNGRLNKQQRRNNRKKGKNGRKRRKKQSEQKYSTTETNSSTRSTSRSIPRSHQNRGESRNGQGSSRLNQEIRGEMNRSRNIRHSQRDGDGNVRHSNKKFPWICSRCQSTNKPHSTHCLKCQKQFEFEKDLPNLKRQHYSHTELISNRSIPEMNSTENEIDETKI